MKNVIQVESRSCKAGHSMIRGSCWEIFYCTEGGAVCAAAGREIPFRSGDVLIFPPGVLCAVKSDDGYAFVRVQFSHASFPAQDVLSFRDDAEGRFLSLLHLLQQAFESKSSNFIGICEALLGTLHQYVLSWQDKSGCESYVDWFIHILESNVSTPGFHPGAVMRQIPFHADYFRRIFKKATGKTPTTYLEELRLEYSKQLIRRGSLKIKEVSRLSGFEDPYYFSRVFKKGTGISPTEY